MADAPLILWFRRDLRVSDHPMLAAAVASGRPLLPVFILDPETEALGAAAKWRLGLALDHFAAVLAGLGAPLVLRRGTALTVLQGLVDQTGAMGVWWSRLYDSAAVARDTAVKAALKAAGKQARSFAGHLLHEPWEVQTGSGTEYKVYTPFWNAVRGRDVAAPSPAPKALRAAGRVVSDRLMDWQMGAAMRCGAAVMAPHQTVGEAAARDRLAAFLAGPVQRYREDRNTPALDATSGLSENLTYGEIGVREVWHAGMQARDTGAAGAEHFLKEVVWREFAYHLLHHFPKLAETSWKPGWQDFGWQGDSADAERWRRGMTGEPLVDAGLREMYVTGRMHNRVRMVVASYLTKHLMTHWRIGLEWFADCLTDWDPAANAMGWQWVAGCGPDAAPYFRVFNPEGQAEKFDPDATYRHRWLAELSRHPGPLALSYFDAVPRSWGLDATSAYPARMIALADGRARALAAYGARKI
ncbi:MAG: deoxyribodipyrimidine photo-lyase [Paracoccaceae bacterium]